MLRIDQVDQVLLNKVSTRVGQLNHLLNHDHQWLQVEQQVWGKKSMIRAISYTDTYRTGYRRPGRAV